MNMQKKTVLQFILIIIPVIIITILSYLIFHDEALLPEAEEWIKPIEFKEDNPRENGFYYAVGFDCAKEHDPFEIGYTWVQSQNQEVDEEIIIVNDLYQAKNQHNKELIYEDEYERVDFSIIHDLLFEDPMENKIPFYVNNADTIDSLMTAFDFLNKRYYKLTKYEYFQNTNIPNYKVSIPWFHSILYMKRLNLAWIGKEYANGNKKVALDKFIMEHKLSRYISENSCNIINKLLSESMIYIDYYFLSDLIDNCSDDLSKYIPNPLTVEEKKWEHTAKHLFKEAMSPFSYLDLSMYDQNSLSVKYQKLIDRANIKINRLTNRYYIYAKYLADISSVNSLEYYQNQNNIPKFKITILDRVLDRGGSFALEYESITSNVKFISLYHNLNGYINMLKLKMMIKQQKITSENIKEFLEAQSDSLFNLYTEEAIKWDAEKSKLHFEGPFEDNNYMREMEIKF